MHKILAVLALVALGSNSQNDIIIGYYTGTCASSDLIEEFNTQLPSSCIAFVNTLDPFYIPAQDMVVTHIINDCDATGTVKYFNDAQCATQLYASGDVTCLQETVPIEIPVIKISCPEAPPPPPPSDCKPMTGLDVKACNRKIRKCGEAAPMRWTGKGCRVRGVIMNDAGCQCMEYCGFGCKSACTSKLNKKYCGWDQGQCFNKVTGKTGPIGNCAAEYEGAGKPAVTSLVSLLGN